MRAGRYMHAATLSRIHIYTTDYYLPYVHNRIYIQQS